MRNCLQKSFGVLVTCCLMVGLAGPASAQWGERSGWGWSSRASIGRLIRQAENDSNRFVAVFGRALDRSRFDDTFREERLNDRASELEQQLNVVRQQFESGGTNSSTRSEVATALNMSRRINQVMHNRQFDYAAERQWSMLRADLNRLARVFNLPQLN